MDFMLTINGKIFSLIHGIINCTYIFIMYYFKTFIFSNCESQAVEVTGWVKLPLCFLNKRFPYKYNLHYPALQTHYWEYLYNLPGMFNRCMEFDHQSSSTS